MKVGIAHAAPESGLLLPAAGATLEKVIEKLPDLNRQDIAAGLSYARDLSEFEVTA